MLISHCVMSMIYSDSEEAHLSHLNIIFHKLRQAGLTVKLRKSQFFRDETSFLGHIITKKVYVWNLVELIL